MTPEIGMEDPDLSMISSEYYEFVRLFSTTEVEKLSPSHSYDHIIPLELGSIPSFGSIYSISSVELESLREYYEAKLHSGFIRHSQSPYGAPILFIKKSDDILYLYMDYHDLNKITTKNRYPLPLIEELLDRISRIKYFTKFDIHDDYHRLRMTAGEEWKTTFRYRYGLFEYTIIPFGLYNTPDIFQYYMNDIFREFLDKFLIVYLDDILIFSDTLEEYKRHVRLILEKLWDIELFLKPNKYQFHV
jgi:hypothetical protein